MGVRLRTTLAATATVAVALALASFALFAALQSSLESSARATAAENASTTAATLSMQPATAVPDDPDVQVLPLGAGTPWRDGSGYAVAEEALPATAVGPVLVQARASLEPVEQAMATLRGLLIPGVPALLALVALLTWLAVGRALKPVSAIRAKVAEITTHDLGQRVPEPDSNDEIAALARTVNGTLDRLQTAVEAHKTFVADAAHELRSPLAILRTRLELAAPESDLATQALTDVARLQSLTTGLLLLAGLDAGEPVRHKELDLAQIVAEEAAQVRPWPEIKVTLDVTPDLLVRGSADQLRRLVANLVDNAVRHADSAVEVRLAAAPGQAVLDVIDDGPGIPAEHRDSVFDRFTRLDHARTRDTGGSGLGLAIAREIATAHTATLEIAPNRAGAHLRAAIPLAQ